MWSTGSKRGKEFKVTPVPENVAIDIGADLLGEIFIFTVGASKIPSLLLAL